MHTAQHSTSQKQSNTRRQGKSFRSFIRKKKEALRAAASLDSIRSKNPSRGEGCSCCSCIVAYLHDKKELPERGRWCSGGMDHREEESTVVSCECCGLEEECTGKYIRGVRAYFRGRWLCGLCSEAVKYEAGKCGGDAAADMVEEAVRAHMAFCRTLKRGGGPAVRVAQGMCQMLRSASGKHRASPSPSSLAIRL